MRIKTIIMTIFFSLCMLVGGSLFLNTQKAQSASDPLVFSATSDFKFDGEKVVGLSDAADKKACTSRSFHVDPFGFEYEHSTSETWVPFEVVIPETSSDGTTITTITATRKLKKRIRTIVPLKPGWTWKTVSFTADCFGYGIQKATIPASIKTIGSSAFLDDDELSAVQLSSNGKKSQLESIGDSAFKDCDILKSFVFSEALKTVGDYAFSWTKLESFTFTSSIEKIGEDAFSSCDQLKTIEFQPATVSKPYILKTIPEDMCYSCDNLAQINIPSSVTTIEYGAFKYCYKLASIVIPSTVTTFESNIFDYSPTVIIAANRDKYLEYTASTHNLSEYSENITYPIRVIYKSDTSSSATTVRTDAKLYKQDVCWYAGSTTSSYWEKKESYSMPSGRWKTASGQIVDVDGLQSLINSSTGDIILYAVPYSIVFNPNTGTGEMKTISNILYSQTVTLPANTFKKTGYLFKCWCVNADGSGDTYLDEAVVRELTKEESITLYAQWEETWAAYAQEPKGGGSSADDPYLISSAQELAWLASQIDSEDGFPNKFFKQTKDIKLTGHNWMPIGNEDTPFKGVFYGNGCIIEDLITSSNENYSGEIIYSYTGLFGNVSGATLNDITLGGYVSGNLYVGAIAGRALRGTILGCRILAPLVEGKQFVGGVVGFAANSTITLCTVCTDFGYVTAKEGIGGGIVGRSGGSTITNCQVESLFITNGNEEGALGGIAGDLIESTISSCILVEVIFPNNGSGYLVGTIDDLSIVKDCLVRNSTCNIEQVFFNTDYPHNINISSCVFNGFYIEGDFENWCYFPDAGGGCFDDFLAPGVSSWLNVATGGNAKDFIENNYSCRILFE